MVSSERNCSTIVLIDAAPYDEINHHSSAYRKKTSLTTHEAINHDDQRQTLPSPTSVSVMVSPAKQDSSSNPSVQTRDRQGKKKSKSRVPDISIASRKRLFSWASNDRTPSGRKNETNASWKTKIYIDYCRMMSSEDGNQEGWSGTERINIKDETIDGIEKLRCKTKLKSESSLALPKDSIADGVFSVGFSDEYITFDHSPRMKQASSKDSDKHEDESSIIQKETIRKRKKKLPYRRHKNVDEEMFELGHDALSAIKKNQGEINLICAKLDSERSEFLTTCEQNTLLYDLGVLLVDCLDQNAYVLEQGGGFVDDTASWIKQLAQEFHRDWAEESGRGLSVSGPVPKSKLESKYSRIPRGSSSKSLSKSQCDCQNVLKPKKKVSFADIEASSPDYWPSSSSRFRRGRDRCNEGIVSQTITQ